MMGAMILLAAFGIGPMSNSAIHAPRWVVGIAGIIFLGCGVMVIDTFQKFATWMAGIVTIGMTVICGWIALFGEDEYFSGGPSIFSDDIEVLIARILFGAVAVLGTAITINALRKIFDRSNG
jgi:hypothetical protein